MVGRPGAVPEHLSVTFSPHHLVGELARALADFAGALDVLQLAPAPATCSTPPCASASAPFGRAGT